MADILDAIFDVMRAAALQSKPARDLTQQEALLVLKFLISRGDIALQEPIKDLKQRQIKVKTSMAGVQYKHASGTNNGVFGSVGAQTTSFFQPTPAFAVALYRFAAYLREKWGATEIVWGGIGAGSGKHEKDCHMNGSCVDFYGATTTRGGVFDVRRDWFLRPVYKANGSIHPLADDDRWGNDTNTHYRLLDTPLGPDLDPNAKGYYNSHGRDFFLDVWTFISEQCMFGKFDVTPAAMRAGGAFMAGYTVHPDYPTFLRRPHNDHIHFQIEEAISKA